MAKGMLISLFPQYTLICDTNTYQISIMSQIRPLSSAVFSKNSGSVTSIVFSIIDVTSYSYFCDICPSFRLAVSFLIQTCSFFEF